MNNSPPVITIDIRKGRIRIYKTTLRLLGRPNYIRLLVNPSTAFLVIEPLSSPKGDYHRIDWRMLDGRNSCELYSNYLIQCLVKACTNWESDENMENYRISGKYYKNNNVAAFNFKEAIPITIAEEELYE